MDSTDKCFKVPLLPNMPVGSATSDSGTRMDDQRTRVLSPRPFPPMAYREANPTAGSVPQAVDPDATVFQLAGVPRGASHSQSTGTGTGPPLTIATSGSTVNQGYSTASQMNGSSIAHMAKEHSVKQLFSTPRKKTTHREYFNDNSVRGQGRSIMSTMDPLVPPFSYGWMRQTFFKDAKLKDSSVRKWLSGSKNLFSFGSGSPLDSRWTIIPEGPDLELELYIPLVDLVTAVLRKFLKPVANIGRTVHDMHATKIEHEEGHCTSPDIVVTGKGPSFQTALNGNQVGYGNVVTFLEAKRHQAMDRTENIEQTAVYARQIFIHQPNRWFVRALIISDQVVQLVHWDRAGAQQSSFHNIHAEYGLFIGLLVRLCDTEDEQANIGLDKSIQWKRNKAGRKVSGHMTEVCEDETKVFPLRDHEPVSSGRQIDGSATVFWKVMDPTAKVIAQKNLLVKDSWSSPGRTEEWKLFKRANDEKIKGICKMIYHKDRRAKISDFRDVSTGVFFDRLFDRIVMEEYGNEIDQFTSAAQFLAALRDGVAAHGNLYGIGILHRDISSKTILLGREGADIGEQGILIDLSAAYDFYRDAKLEISKEPIMGPRFYQSCTILEFLTDLNEDEFLPYAPAHDYLDDMESFFDVFCHVMLEFLPNGAERADEDKARLILEDWDHVSPRTALAAKLMILDPMCRDNERARDYIEDSWGLACAKLFDEYSGWVRKIRLERTRLLRGYEKRIRQMIEKSGVLAEAPNAQHPEAQKPGAEQTNAPEPIISQPSGEQPNAPQPSVKTPSDQRPGTQESPEDVYESVFADLYSEAESHYKDVITMIHKAILSLENCPASLPDPPPVKIPKGRKKGKQAKRPRAQSTIGGGNVNKVIKLSHPRSRQSSMAGNTSRPQLPPSTPTSMDTSA